jgi:hypothetical protein
MSKIDLNIYNEAQNINGLMYKLQLVNVKREIANSSIY